MEKIYREIIDILFNDIDELEERKEEIREGYKRKSREGKEIYKWYFFYKLGLHKERVKEAYWEYIVGIGKREKTEREYNELKNRRVKLTKREKDEIMNRGNSSK